MKKSRNRPAKPRKRGAQKAAAASVDAQAPESDISRRTLLSRFGKYGVGAAALLAGGAYFYGDMKETMAEEDLSRIGNGVPTIVQVHDPTCPTCRALQREARAAMEGFSDGELQYVVANLAKRDGQALAAQHGVGKITLLVFDRRGNRQEILSGPNTRERLERIFSAYAAKPSREPAPQPKPEAKPEGAPTS